MDGWIGAFGICIVSDEAFAVGSTAIPGPVSEADWDGWFVHQFFSARTMNVRAAANNEIQDNWGVFNKEIDSKAMRKFSQGNTMVAMIEATEIGAGSLVFNWDSRILVKLT